MLDNGPRGRVAATWSRRLLAVLGTVLLAGALVLAIPPGEAHAAPEDLIVFADESFCEVRMQNVHASLTVAGEASVAVDVRCHPAGAPRAALVVEEITAETTISFSRYQPIPAFLPAVPIGTCDRIVFVRRAAATLPCHQSGRTGGYYVGESTVTVTHLGVTEEVVVSRTNTFAPTA